MSTTQRIWRNQAYPRAWQERAELLAWRGYNAAEIVEHLRDEGKEVPLSRVVFWTDGITRDAEGNRKRRPADT